MQRPCVKKSQPAWFAMITIANVFIAVAVGQTMITGK